jgi:hypothetical protein
MLQTVDHRDQLGTLHYVVVVLTVKPFLTRRRMKTRQEVFETLRGTCRD